MRIPSWIHSGGMPINMAPMIDVVFQLIVFFTATSTIAKSEVNQTLDLPVAEKGKDHADAGQHRKITANVLPSGDIVLAGRTIDAAEFQELLRAELKQHAASQLEVQLRTDRSAPYGAVQPLLVACARAGVCQVSFAVKQPERR